MIVTEYIHGSKNMQKLFIFLQMVILLYACNTNERWNDEKQHYNDIALQLRWERLGDHTAYHPNNKEYLNIKKAVISPDNRFVLSGNNMGNDIILWDAETGVSKWEKILDDKTLCVGFSTENDHAITGNSDSSAKIWNTKSGKLIKTLALQSVPESITFSQKLALMAICCTDGSVSVWKLKNYQLVKTITSSSFPSDSASENHSSNIKSVSFSPDDRFLMTINNHGKIYFWDAKDFSLANTLNAAKEKIQTTCISPDGKIFAYTYKDDNQNSSGFKPEILVLWCLKSNEEIYRHEFPSGLQSILFTPNNQFLMAYGAEGKNLDKPFSEFSNTYFFKLQYKDNIMDSIHLIRKSKSYLPEFVRFNQNGDLLISSHNDGMLRLWQVSYH